MKKCRAGAEALAFPLFHAGKPIPLVALKLEAVLGPPPLLPPGGRTKSPVRQGRRRRVEGRAKKKLKEREGGVEKKIFPPFGRE